MHWYIIPHRKGNLVYFILKLVSLLHNFLNFELNFHENMKLKCWIISLFIWQYHSRNNAKFVIWKHVIELSFPKNKLMWKSLSYKNKITILSQKDYGFTYQWCYDWKRHYNETIVNAMDKDEVSCFKLWSNYGTFKHWIKNKNVSKK